MPTEDRMNYLIHQMHKELDKEIELYRKTDETGKREIVNKYDVLISEAKSKQLRNCWQLFKEVIIRERIRR